MGFAPGGLLHAINFGNQNAFYAIHKPGPAIIANILALLATTAGNAATYFYIDKAYQPFFFGVALSSSDLIKLMTYEIAYSRLAKRDKRTSCCHYPSKLLAEWREYAPAIPIMLTTLLDKVTEFLTLWRIAKISGDAAVDVMNLAMPVNALFLLFTVEAVQSCQSDIKSAFNEHDTKKMLGIYWKLSGVSLIMPSIYIIVAALSSYFDFYGFERNDCLIGLGSMAALNMFNSHSFVMKQLMLADKIVTLPALISIMLLWAAFGLSFIEEFNTFTGIMAARAAAYLVQDICFTLGCRDWIERGEDSIFKQAENTLDGVKLSCVNCCSWFQTSDEGEASTTEEVLDETKSLINSPPK